MVLSVTNLTKIIPHPSIPAMSQTVFADINFTLMSDSPIIIVRGVSGSGKSTLMRTVVGVESPDAGRVMFDSQNVHSVNFRKRQKLRRQTGFIHQFPQDSIDFSLNSNINLELHLAEQNEELAKLLGIDKVLDNPISTYSGGELRRFLVYRELCRSPRFLICDEPTAQLDNENAKIVWSAIEKYVNENECVAIVATHDDAVTGSYPELTLEKKVW